MAQALWRPAPERVAKAAVTQFTALASRHAGREFADYFDLHDWSVSRPAEFWGLYSRYAGLPFSRREERVMSDEPMPRTKWFEGAELNYAEALLHPPGLAGDDHLALIACDESGAERSLSYRDLRLEVARVQAALRAEGVEPGDRIAAFSANLPETVVLLLACAASGIIFTSCSPDFGLQAASARFSQVGPKLLFATTSYRYGGKRYDVAGVVAGLAEQLSVRRVVALPYPGEAGGGEGHLGWSEWLSSTGTGAGAKPDYLPLPFDHPLYVLYSSGTTGAPKAIVHRAGGALLNHHKEHRLHCDIRPGDRVLYFTTCGWMMWNWLVSALAQAATVVLFEGSPAHPNLMALWELSERLQFTFFGAGARYLQGLASAGVRPERNDLESLRTVASTGSPLSPRGFEYVYRHVKSDVHLASISGGTDIVGCFMLGVPTLPVWSGQIQAPGLGVDLAAYDERGEPVVGRPGELVCRKPLPSMPLHFWNDEGGERMHRAYFARYPGVWHHGDLVELTEQRGIIVYGRSDATLNPGGVRIGTAEIYAPLDDLSEVLEAAAVGRREGADESIWLFVVLTGGALLDDRLVERIRSRIREGASPRHVPKRVLQVAELPRTRSGKAMELAVANVVNGKEIANRAVIANPESLAEVERVTREALAEESAAGR